MNAPLRPEYFDVEQGSDEWLQVRAGVPTSSQFATVLAAGGKGEDALTRKTYMRKLCGERITGRPSQNFRNRHTDRGHELEPEARNLYSLLNDVDFELAGFAKRHDLGAGASPDCLIGKQGGAEIKTKLEHLQIEVLDSGQVPKFHLPQIQGLMWITIREWWDFVSYCPGLPLFVKRVYRDEAFIARLAVAVEEFNFELAALEARIRAMMG